MKVELEDSHTHVNTDGHTCIHLQAGAFSGLDNSITNTSDTPTARFQVCVCVCVCAWVRARVHACARVCTCCVCVCVYIYIYIYIYICVCVCVCIQSTSLKLYFRFHVSPITGSRSTFVQGKEIPVDCSAHATVVPSCHANSSLP